MGFIYRVLWIVKALLIGLSEAINILRNLEEFFFFFFFGGGEFQEFHHM